MYQKDLMQYGQDMASKFASAFMQVKIPEVMAMAEVTITAGPMGMATQLEDVTMESELPGKTKAIEKCQIKSSTKEQSIPVNDPHGEASASALVTKAGPVVSHQPEEMEATTNITTVTGGGDTSNEPLVYVQMLNQVREMVFRLLNQSKILDECQVRVAQPISKAVSKHTTKLFQPFTLYIADVSYMVETWHKKVMLICPEMAHCNYNTYCACSASVRERTNEFFRKLWDLNTHLDQQTLPMKPVLGVKPDGKDDSGLGSSIDAMTPGSSSTETDCNNTTNPLQITSMTVAQLSEDDPFLIEVTTIMEDVESSVKWYV